MEATQEPTTFETGTSIYKLDPWLPASVSGLQPIPGVLRWRLRFPTGADHVPEIPVWQKRYACVTKGGGLSVCPPGTKHTANDKAMFPGVVGKRYRWVAEQGEWAEVVKTAGTKPSGVPTLPPPPGTVQLPAPLLLKGNTDYFDIESGWFDAEVTNQALANVVNAGERLWALDEKKYPGRRTLAKSMMERTANVAFDIPTDDAIVAPDGTVVPIVWEFWWTAQASSAHADAMTVADLSGWKLPNYEPWVRPNSYSWMSFAAVAGLVVGGIVVSGLSAAGAAAGAAVPSAVTTATTTTAAAGAATPGLAGALSGLGSLVSEYGALLGLGLGAVGGTGSSEADAAILAGLGSFQGGNVDWNELLGAGAGLVANNNPEWAELLGGLFPGSSAGSAGGGGMLTAQPAGPSLTFAEAQSWPTWMPWVVGGAVVVALVVGMRK